jgi:hypothetical protein
MLQPKHFFTYLTLIFLIVGCNEGATRSTFLPPSTYKAADLIGTWKTVEDIYDLEYLTLRNDHTFTHQYTVPQGSLHLDEQGQWWEEQRPSGCIYIHLKGMTYVDSGWTGRTTGNRDSLGNPIRVWERCEDRTFPMPDEVILVVGAGPNFARSLVLIFPQANAEDNTDFMGLCDLPNKFGEVDCRSLN